jgi:hypothetical protein
MGIDKFANKLSFVWAFFNNLAIVLKEMINEKFIELLRGAVSIFIYSSCKTFTKD